MIEWVFNSSRGAYRYRRTHAALARRGVETSPDTVRSIMREQGLEAAQPRRKDPAPPSRPPDLGSRPDLVRRDFTANRPGEQVGGRYHVYPHPGRDPICLATVPGCCTKKAVGYAIGATTCAPSPLCEAIDMAARRCPYTTGETIFHPRPGVPVHLRAARPASGEI